MKQIVNPTFYRGKIKAPASKSYMQRAIGIALLAEGETHIFNPAFCNDTYSILKIAAQLGADVHVSEEMVSIKGNLNFQQNVLSVGESGLGIRMMTPIVSLFPQKTELTGKGSLLKRPIEMLEAPLTSLGVKVKTEEGFLPISVEGPLQGGEAHVDGSISSQVLSGLLIALPKAQEDSILHVHQLQSIPYVNMTLEILRDFGVEISHENYQIFHIQGQQNYQAREYTVEGDWSNAAFHLVGGAIAGEIIVTGINTISLQADRAIINALETAGAQVEMEENQVKVTRKNLKAFSFDATHCPDLFPPLVVLASACQGTTSIKGVNRLLFKESNRALVLKNEMGKLGISIKLEGDFMLIKGGKIRGGKIHSNNDHRIAMAAAIAGLIAENPIEIEQAEAVAKSYPYFFRDFEDLQKSILPSSGL